MRGVGIWGVALMQSIFYFFTYGFAFGREGVKDGADISDLTWEQKEQVLRLMFSKMNRRAQCVSQPMRSASPASRSHGASNDAPALPDKYVW